MNIRKKLKDLWCRICRKKKLVVFSPFMGGLSLSDCAIEALIEKGVPEEWFNEKDENHCDQYSKNKKYYQHVPRKLRRHDERLVEVIFSLKHWALGEDCDGVCIAEISAHVEYIVHEDNEFGSEWVAEKHAIWGREEDILGMCKDWMSSGRLYREIRRLIHTVTEARVGLSRKIEAQDRIKQLIHELEDRGHFERYNYGDTEKYKLEVPDIVTKEELEAKDYVQ